MHQCKCLATAANECAFIKDAEEPLRLSFLYFNSELVVESVSVDLLMLGIA